MNLMLYYNGLYTQTDKKFLYLCRKQSKLDVITTISVGK